MKILVVEDDRMQQELTVDALKNSDLRKYGILDISVVSSGEECLEEVSKNSYEIILLDYNLGGEITGIDILKKIILKKMDTAVIMVTGSGDEKVAVEAMKNGAYDYLVKFSDYLTILPMVTEKTIEKLYLKREQKKHEERISNLLRASIGLTKFDDLNRLLEFILKLVCDALSADGGSIMLFDKKKKELEVKVAIGTRADEIVGKRLPVGNRIAGLVAEQRKPILLVGDIKNYPHFKELAKYEDVHSGITVVLLKKELLGVMNIKRTVKKYEFTEQDLNILSIFAGNVTTTIETMKVYTELDDIKIKLDEKLKEIKNFQFELTKPERITMMIELAGIVGCELEPRLGNIRKLIYETKLIENSDFYTKVKTILSELIISENLIKNLLYFSREEKNEFKPTNINDVIEDTINSIDDYISSKSLNIKKTLDPKVPLILTDSNKISQVFINIILNAIESKSNNPELIISTKLIKEKDEIYISFRDNGLGIFHESDFINVFNPLYTTKTDKLGLGLSVCKKIISSHNGTIKITSKFQEFTEVIINLPIKLDKCIV